MFNFIIQSDILSTGGDAIAVCELRRPGNSQGENWKVCNMTNFMVGNTDYALEAVTKRWNGILPWSMCSWVNKPDQGA